MGLCKNENGINSQSQLDNASKEHKEELEKIKKGYEELIISQKKKQEEDKAEYERKLREEMEAKKKATYTQYKPKDYNLSDTRGFNRTIENNVELQLLKSGVRKEALDKTMPTIQIKDIKKEEEDPFNISVISIQFLALKSLISGSYFPSKIYFATQFFTFNDQRSDIVILDESPNEGNLRLFRRENKGVSGVYMEFKVDLEAEFPGMHKMLANYLYMNSMNINVYDAESHILFAQTQFKLSELLRQGKSECIVSREIDVFKHDEIIGAMILTATNKGSKSDIPKSTEPQVYLNSVISTTSKRKKKKIVSDGITNEELISYNFSTRKKQESNVKEEALEKFSTIKSQYTSKKIDKELLTEYKQYQKNELIASTNVQVMGKKQTITLTIGEPKYLIKEIVNASAYQETFKTTIIDKLSICTIVSDHQEINEVFKQSKVAYDSNTQILDCDTGIVKPMNKGIIVFKYQSFLKIEGEYIIRMTLRREKGSLDEIICQIITIPIIIGTSITELVAENSKIQFNLPIPYERKTYLIKQGLL